MGNLPFVDVVVAKLICIADCHVAFDDQRGSHFTRAV